MLVAMTELAVSHQRGWVPNDDTFGARLALVRQRMSWGNTKIAAVECGIPTQSWRRWERGGSVPVRLFEVCALIAERTGVDLGWLIGGPRLTQRTTDGLPTRLSRAAQTTPLPARPTSGAPAPASRRPQRIPRHHLAAA